MRYESETADLVESKDLLLKELDAWPRLFDLEEAIKECENATSHSLTDFVLWTSRFDKLSEMESDFTNFLSTHEKLFNLYGESASVSGKLTMDDIRRAAETDMYLKQVFRKIKGKETLMSLSGGSVVVDNNPLAWVSNNIIECWNFFPSSCNEGHAKKFHSDSLSPNLIASDDKYNFMNHSRISVSDELHSPWVKPLPTPTFFAGDAEFGSTRPKKTTTKQKGKLRGDEEVTLISHSTSGLSMPPIIFKSSNKESLQCNAAIPPKLFASQTVSNRSIETDVEVDEMKFSGRRKKIKMSYSLPSFSEPKIDIHNLLLTSKSQISKVQSANLSKLEKEEVRSNLRYNR